MYAHTLRHARLDLHVQSADYMAKHTAFPDGWLEEKNMNFQTFVSLELYISDVSNAYR